MGMAGIVSIDCFKKSAGLKMKNLRIVDYYLSKTRNSPVMTGLDPSVALTERLIKLSQHSNHLQILWRKTEG